MSSGLQFTYTQTYESIHFANPYKICLDCGGWIEGVIVVDEGPDLTIPCEHACSYKDVCPSWGPVDGCTCIATLGYKPHGEPKAAVDI